MSSRWKQQRRKDIFRRLADEKGYRSRASFKLVHIQSRHKFIKEGDLVLDLGAAPGGMSQVASDAAGSEGLVVAVDKNPIKPFRRRNIVILQANVDDPTLADEILTITGRRLVNKVIADISPKLTGIRELDVARQTSLAEAGLELADRLLKKGGGFLLKVFEGPEASSIEKKLKSKYRSVRRIVPPATRKSSSEIFLMATERL